MTYNPADLTALMAYWTAQGGVNLGIKGDASHVTKARSYHLGADQLTDYSYSASTARDKAGIAEWPNAASAVDLGELGGSIGGLRRFSGWFVERCRANAPGTSDVRDFIYSLDGTTVLRWDRERGVASAPKAGEADASHLAHSHISTYRDSRERDKTALFRAYFEEAEVITAIKGEDWKPTVTKMPDGTERSNGVYRATPVRNSSELIIDDSGQIARLPAGTIIRTIAEVKANGDDWRMSKSGRGSAPVYFLRSDLAPLVPGGDPAVDQQLTDYMNRVPTPDCGPLVQAEYARVTSNTTATVHFPGPPA